MSGRPQNPRENAQLPDRDGERQSDLAVMDQEEYKNKRRLERLLDAHDRVEEWDNQSMAALVNGRLQKEGRDIMLFRAVKQFIREAFNALRDHYETYQVEGAPERPDGYWVTESPIGVIEMEHREDVEFYGLRDFLGADRMYYEEWSETVETRHGPNQTEEHHRSYSIPEDVSMRAFLTLKEFLDEERGLDLSFSESKGDADFSYSHIKPDGQNPEQNGTAQVRADGEGGTRE